MSLMDRDEQDRLLDELIDGSISEADRLKIEAEMIVDGTVRKNYYRRMQFEFLLRDAAGSNSGDVNRDGAASIPTGAPTAGIPQGIGNGTTWRIVAVAGLVMSIQCVAFLVQRRSGSKPIEVREGVELSAAGYGVLRGERDANWDGHFISTGDLLPTQTLRLNSGSVHIELFSGVQLVIEGAAEFSVDSPMQVTLSKGTARARVPQPARGFSIRTASGKIVDLGTEFAVSATLETSSVQVLDGEVEWVGVDESRRLLADGQGAIFSRLNDSIVTLSAEIAVVGPSDFESDSKARRDVRIAAWENEFNRVLSDPRMVGCYRFFMDQNSDRTIVNRCLKSNLANSDGAVVVAEPSTDRWGRSSHGLDFSRLGSRVRVNVPGEHRGLSLNAWVKIHSLDRWYNSLFLTDGHEPHWQIMNDGRVFFSVKRPGDSQSQVEVRQHVFYSPPFWSPKLAGKWIMLSVTYDVADRTVTHYLDGEVMSKEAIADVDLVEIIKIGESSIGNWNDPRYRTDAEFVIRNLNGSMDEFCIYTGALSKSEINAFYRMGKSDADAVDK